MLESNTFIKATFILMYVKIIVIKRSAWKQPCVEMLKCSFSYPSITQFTMAIFTTTHFVKFTDTEWWNIVIRWYTSLICTANKYNTCMILSECYHLRNRGIWRYLVMYWAWTYYICISPFPFIKYYAALLIRWVFAISRSLDTTLWVTTLRPFIKRL